MRARAYECVFMCAGSSCGDHSFDLMLLEQQAEAKVVHPRVVRDAREVLRARANEPRDEMLGDTAQSKPAHLRARTDVLEGRRPQVAQVARRTSSFEPLGISAMHSSTFVVTLLLDFARVNCAHAKRRACGRHATRRSIEVGESESPEWTAGQRVTRRTDFSSVSSQGGPLEASLARPNRAQNCALLGSGPSDLPTSHDVCRSRGLIPARGRGAVVEGACAVLQRTDGTVRLSSRPGSRFGCIAVV